MPDQAVLTTEDRTPRWAVWVLLAAIPIVFWQALISLAAALSVFPVADTTLPVIAVVALLSRRWNGASRRWFRAAGVLVAVMAVEWVVLYAAMFTGRIPGDPAVLNAGFGVYSVESILLLVVYVVASLLSVRGIRRAPAVGA